MRTALLFSTAALALAACSQGGSLKPSTAEIPAIAENFQLVDQNRDVFELRYYADAPAVVLLSAASGDKVSAESGAALKALSDTYTPKGAVLAMVNSTPGATFATVKADAVAGGFDGLQVLVDENQLVGETLGVTRAAEAFVINPKTWTIVYRGPVGAVRGAGRRDGRQAGGRLRLVRGGRRA